MAASYPNLGEFYAPEVIATSTVSSPSQSQLSGSTQSSPNDQTLDNTGYCLLSLDGGGVRGLSTLYILQSLMDRLNYLREESGLKPVKPCEIFDLIGGTSTGGLIAIMLGRLEMRVDECIEAYSNLMKHVFEKKKNNSFLSLMGKVQPRFSAKALEEAISQVIRERGFSPDERFENGTKPRCKVFVCTKFQSTNATTRLRSYRLPVSSDFKPTILEAALATSAAPTYFSDATIQGSKFVDGAIGANNPAVEVEDEARDLWCEETRNLHPLVKCFISVGTGHPGIRSVSDKGIKHFLETLKKEATETEATNQQWQSRWREHMEKDRAFRFNVHHGLEDVGLAEFKQQDLIHSAAATYLNESGTKGQVRMCVENLRKKLYKASREFNQKMNDEVLAQAGQPPSQTLQRATDAEISELINLGNQHLKLPPSAIRKDNLLQARHYFSKALFFLSNNNATTPSHSPFNTKTIKSVARLCIKLTDTLLALSMLSHSSPEHRKEYADLAVEYVEAALDNVVKANDPCMVAQVQFLAACLSAWRVYVAARAAGVEPRAHPAREGVERLMNERLNALRKFVSAGVRMDGNEEKARKFLRYLDAGVGMWEVD